MSVTWLPRLHACSLQRRALANAGRGRGGRGGGRGRGRGGGRGNSGCGNNGEGTSSNGNNNGKKFNGISLADPNRTFSVTEFQKLGAAGREYVYENLDKKDDRKVAAVKTEIEDDPPTEDGADNGNRGAQNGNTFGPNKHRRVSAINSTTRHSTAGNSAIKAVKTAKDTGPGHTARNEFDSHADTGCAGANWTPIAFTGQTCNVAPYSEEYEPMIDVPVATCATALTDPNGRTTILVCHQMLWFGTKLRNSLIKPNKLRLGGTNVFDDLTEESLALT